jgi:hypothetical protein
MNTLPLCTVSYYNINNLEVKVVQFGLKKLFPRKPTFEMLQGLRKKRAALVTAVGGFVAEIDN